MLSFCFQLLEVLRCLQSLLNCRIQLKTARQEGYKFITPPTCRRRISTISLHFLPNRWEQVGGEPWVLFTREVRQKALADVILRPPSVPISAPALVWVHSRLQGQTKRETAVGCQGNTGATHTHVYICTYIHTHTHTKGHAHRWRCVYTSSGMCGEYVTGVVFAAWASVCRLKLRDLSRLQLMSKNLKLAVCP